LNILNITNSVRNHNTQSLSFVNVLDTDFIENHIFKIEDMKSINGSLLYKISFRNIRRKTSYNHKATGNIYISKNNFSIYKLNYNLFYGSSKSPQYSVTLEYSPKGDKMFLNYIMFNNLFTVKSEDYLKIIISKYDKINYELQLIFNKAIEESSLEPISKNIEITFKNRKLKILDVMMERRLKKTLLLKLDSKQINELGFFDETSDNPKLNKNIKIDVKNIIAENGSILDVPPIFNFYQFREFFVQEVFENKDLSTGKNFINKNLPLSEAKITPLILENDYWLNTPLKSNK
jgi:hypothetical protein